MYQSSQIAYSHNLIDIIPDNMESEVHNPIITYVDMIINQGPRTSTHVSPKSQPKQPQQTQPTSNSRSHNGSNNHSRSQSHGHICSHSDSHGPQSTQTLLQTIRTHIRLFANWYKRFFMFIGFANIPIRFGASCHNSAAEQCCHI